MFVTISKINVFFINKKINYPGFPKTCNNIAIEDFCNFFSPFHVRFNKLNSWVA
jgi:hypothetical protein